MFLRGDSEVLIRNAERKDLERVLYIVHKTIADVYPAYYPTGVVEFFIQHHSNNAIKDDIEKKRVFVLVIDDEIIGTVTIKEDSINRLFVLPNLQGKGFGGILMDFAEQFAFENYKVVQVDASFSAKAMYLKRGYIDVEYHCIKTDSGQFLCYDVMKKEKL